MLTYGVEVLLRIGFGMLRRSGSSCAIKWPHKNSFGGFNFSQLEFSESLYSACMGPQHKWHRSMSTENGQHRPFTANGNNNAELPGRWAKRRFRVSKKPLRGKQHTECSATFI
jgi:hypothetical protein